VNCGQGGGQQVAGLRARGNLKAEVEEHATDIGRICRKHAPWHSPFMPNAICVMPGKKYTPAMAFGVAALGQHLEGTAYPDRGLLLVLFFVRIIPEEAILRHAKALRPSDLGGRLFLRPMAGSAIILGKLGQSDSIKTHWPPPAPSSSKLRDG